MNDEQTHSSMGEQNQYRDLLKQEQRRVAHLSLINAVQRCVLSAPDYVSFLPLVARILSEHFDTCDVAVYLAEPLPEAN